MLINIFRHTFYFVFKGTHSWHSIAELLSFTMCRDDTQATNIEHTSRTLFKTEH